MPSGDPGLNPPPELGHLQVQEDEEGAEEAAQQAQQHAGDQRQDVDVDPVLDLEEDVLLRRELTKTWGGKRVQPQKSCLD